MLRSGEMGSLSAGAGSPTAGADKARGQREPAPGAAGAAPGPDGGAASAPRPAGRDLGPGARSAELQAQEPLAGLSITQICPFAKRSLRKHLGQCRPSSQITFLPNDSPISPRPVLNFTRFGSGAEFTHREPSRTGHPAASGTVAAFQAAMHEAVPRVIPPQQGKPCCHKLQHSCSWLH